VGLRRFGGIHPVHDGELGARSDPFEVRAIGAQIKSTPDEPVLGHDRDKPRILDGTCTQWVVVDVDVDADAPGVGGQLTAAEPDDPWAVAATLALEVGGMDEGSQPESAPSRPAS
jgi:hypothetical protein